jgi:hypothetical protein
MLLLVEFEQYMITPKLIQTVLLNKRESIVREKKKQAEKETNKMLVPTEKDTLFWCFYIMKNGDLDYETIQQQNVNIFVIEKKLKIDYVEKLRKEKQLLVRQYKFAALTEIENQLANESKINLETFFTLCVIEKINVLYVNNKTYFELSPNDDKITHLIHRLDNKSTNNYHAIRVGYEGVCTIKAENYRTSLYKMEDINKPLKSLTSYKVNELFNIAHVLGIKIEKGEISKKELYEKLILFF